MHQMTIDEILTEPPAEEGDDQEAGGDGVEHVQEDELDDVEPHGDEVEDDDEPDE